MKEKLKTYNLTVRHTSIITYNIDIEAKDEEEAMRIADKHHNLERACNSYEIEHVENEISIN